MSTLRSILAGALTRQMILADYGTRGIVTNISRGPVNTHATLANGRKVIIRSDSYVRIWG